MGVAKMSENKPSYYYVMTLVDNNPVLVKVRAEDAEKYGNVKLAVKYRYCHKFVSPITCEPRAVYTESEFNEKIPYLYVKTRCSSEEREELIELFTEDEAETIRKEIEADRPGCVVSGIVYNRSPVWFEIVRFYQLYKGLPLKNAIWRADGVIEKFVVELPEGGPGEQGPRGAI